MEVRPGLQDREVVLQPTPGIWGVQLAVQQVEASVAPGVASIGQDCPPVCILEIERGSVITILFI